MFCSECGKQIKDDAKFCPYCGTPVAVKVKTPEQSDKQSSGDSFFSAPDGAEAEEDELLNKTVALGPSVPSQTTGLKMSLGAADVHREEHLYSGPDMTGRTQPQPVPRVPPARLKSDAVSGSYAGSVPRKSGNKGLFIILIALLAVMFLMVFGAYAYMEGWIDFPTSGSQVTVSSETESGSTAVESNGTGSTSAENSAA